jgi:hypothetical protein
LIGLSNLHTAFVIRCNIFKVIIWHDCLWLFMMQHSDSHGALKKKALKKKTDLWLEGSYNI